MTVNCYLNQCNKSFRLNLAYFGEVDVYVIHSRDHHHGWVLDAIYACR